MRVQSAEIPALFCRLTRVKIGVRVDLHQEVRRSRPGAKMTVIVTRHDDTRIRTRTFHPCCRLDSTRLFCSQTEQNKPIKRTQSNKYPIKSKPPTQYLGTIYMHIKLRIALLSFAVVPLIAFVPPRLVATKAKTALSSRVGSKTALYVKSLQVRIIDRICICVDHINEYFC